MLRIYFHRLITAIIADEKEKTGRLLTERDALATVTKDLRMKHIRRRVQSPENARKELQRIFRNYANKRDSCGVPLLKEVFTRFSCYAPYR